MMWLIFGIKISVWLIFAYVIFQQFQIVKDLKEIMEFQKEKELLRKEQRELIEEYDKLFQLIKILKVEEKRND